MKKLLVVSAIAALGLNSVASAGGLPEEMMMDPMAYGSEQGIYVGIEGGFGMTHWKNVENEMYFVDKAMTSGLLAKSVSKDTGAVGRAFLGYDINKYFAVEAGYTYFFNKPELGGEFIKNGVVTSFKDAKFVKRTHAIDLMGKLKAPVTEELNIYAKLGAVYLMTQFEGGDSDDKSYSHDNINVAYGAGIDYFITPNIIANVEWLRFNGNDKTDKMWNLEDGKYQPNTDAFMVGLRYKFDL